MINNSELHQFIEETILEATSSDILSKTSQKILDDSDDCVAKLSRVDRNNSVWHYQVYGKTNTYTVKIKMLDQNKKHFDDSDILIKCNCKFFRWQGPEHWAKVEKYMYQNPEGTASFPAIRDPEGVKKVCKHCVSALLVAKNISL